jgi:hypothetical protein
LLKKKLDNKTYREKSSHRRIKMAINRIDLDIQSHKTTQGSVSKATSGKKEQVEIPEKETKKVSLEDNVLFSEDAKKLQETEVILQNALQKLHEMDEINHKNLASIKEKISSSFYDSEQVLTDVADEVFTEDELKAVIKKRMMAEKYVEELHELDSDSEIDFAKLNIVKERINSGFYNSKEVIDKVAEELLDVLGT